ncbi:VCBS repeat-containing protein [Jiulongibacter sediminis]|uniref:VCBS repeat-containing protein n=1 Tax=Jiulongibacter sediminis TaxID=1605367 RepID=UPI0026F01855|nr:VCBS repeat-containing protein [Jiulongibacter sediminis]
MQRRIAIFLIVLSALSCKKESTLFELVNSTESGITFSNTIIENDTINILSFDYIYNGAGVGVGDFDGDGNQDLFFSGNQTENKLYLNRGDFKFEEITEIAGVAGKNKWSSGVAIVDINQDGLMDIYVAATSTNNSVAKDRENTLFVNQGLENGIPIFKEMAAEYGVNDDGHSENAAFFDYDNDGDLDLYVLTNKIDQFPNFFREKYVAGENPNTDRLYRNDYSDSLGHAYFTNVSKEAGIQIEGFGLGINITDINRDGWKDIFVTNDYVTNDLIYINNQDGTFTNKLDDYLKHTSHSAMGNDIADINNDGLNDIIALDMVPRDNKRKKLFTPANSSLFFQFSDKHKFNYQYGRNTLQLNNGEGQPFSDISFYADVAETDWSWTPSVADFDNDKYRDLLVTNGFPKDVTDMDFMAYRAEIENLVTEETILEKIPAVKITNYGFKNNGDLSFSDKTEEWGLKRPSFSNGAVYVDLDNDGDLDYVVNNINDEAFVYRNTSNDSDGNSSNYLRLAFKGGALNRNGIGARVEAIYQDGEKFSFENSSFRGYKSTVEPFCHIGMGKDSLLSELRVIWPNGKMQIMKDVGSNQVLTVNLLDAELDYVPEIDDLEPLFEEFEINFTHSEADFLDFNFQNLIPFRLSQMGPALAVGDVNGDNLEDVFLGGPVFKQGRFLLQNSNGGFENALLLPKVDSASKIEEDTGVLLFDADNDGDNDLYVVSGGNEKWPQRESFLDRLYVNDGKGKFELTKNALPEVKTAGSCVRACDYDGDGDLDLFVAGRNVPHKYPMPTSSYILKNESVNGVPKFSNVTEAIIPDLIDIGLICDGLWTDFDGDGDNDLIVAGDFMEITVFRNTEGRFEKLSETGLEGIKGLWSSINGADFDLDGDVDYIVGNIGENALFKGTPEYPVEVYSADFDGNGVYDIIPFVYFRDSVNNRIQVPYNTRDDLNKQLNPIRTRFKTFGEFTKAGLDNVLTEAEREKARKDILNFNASVYVENLGGGKFKVKKLPVRAQLSAMNGTNIQDFNQDGYPDVLMVGNNFGNEQHSGRYDASNGLLLINDQKGGFVESWSSGFLVPGDGKALVSFVDTKGGLSLMASQNQGKMKGFRSGLKVEVAPKGSNRVRFKVHGKESVRELYVGSSYLSQSGRGIVLPAGATDIRWE